MNDKPRYIYEATDIHVDRADDGSSVLSVPTNGDVDLSILLTAELLERLRARIDFPKAQ